jgi:ribose transport system permease protein
VSSAVLGGVSIYGGVGTALGAFVGTIFIKLISNTLNFLQASYYMTLVVKGIVIVAFVAIDSLFRRRYGGTL